MKFWNDAYPQLRDLAYVLLPSEIINLGERNFTESEIESIRKRSDGFALFNNEGYLLTELERVLRKKDVVFEKEIVDPNVGEIKGKTAYPGLVKGCVRLVVSREQISVLQSGEVLVTEMTNPDFVPAMKRALAVITDEGGVMCHAAIASRELRVPCIIGTKIATKVLKDGDLVEVDADRGIVKVINKK